MKPLFDAGDTNSAKIESLKRAYGMYYGIAAGLGFAGASWGWDGYLLSSANGYLPWVKFIAGVILCVVAGGLIGRFTSISERSLVGFLIWLACSSFFAWLTIAVPLQITPLIASNLDPQLGLMLDYGADIGFMLRLGTALMWIAPFMAIAGLIQLPLVEPAVFSTSFFGKIGPLLVGMIIMGIAGGMTDTLINAHFRNATIAMDNTIQFVLDNEGKDVDPGLSRRMFSASLRSVRAYVSDSRRLFVGDYDEYLDIIHVLVQFEEGWVDCSVIYEQPGYCQAWEERQ